MMTSASGNIASPANVAIVGQRRALIPRAFPAAAVKLPDQQPDGHVAEACHYIKCVGHPREFQQVRIVPEAPSSCVWWADISLASVGRRRGGMKPAYHPIVAVIDRARRSRLRVARLHVERSLSQPGRVCMRSLLFVSLAASIGFASASAAAASVARRRRAAACRVRSASVPEALRPWIPWVMHDHEAPALPRRCPATTTARARGRGGSSWRWTRAAASSRRPGR